MDDILSLATEDDETSVVPLDSLIHVPGCDHPALLQLAAEHYEAYAANIQVGTRLTFFEIEIFFIGLSFYCCCCCS